MSIKYCENCGKRLNQTLICDACGTDYNEKPICEHFYDQYMITPEELKHKTWLYFKCKKCGESKAIPCDPLMVIELRSSLYIYGR